VTVAYVSRRERAYIGLSAAPRIFHAHVASDDAYTLGEGPLWDAPRQRVLWVDINGHRVHAARWRDGGLTDIDEIQFDQTVGAVVCSDDGDLLVAAARGLVRIDRSGVRTPGVQIIPDAQPSRLNDGSCDPQGRFLIGSMALDDRRGKESLVRVEGEQVIAVDTDLTLSNGLTWSLDDSRMYSIDTTPGVVWVRSYGPDDEVGERRVFLHVADGSPDGMCTDASGNIWIAIWGRGQVRCFTPAGEHLATVEVPSPNTTSVCFVGEGLDQMLITSAREQLSDEQLRNNPNAGHLFLCDVDVTGAPVAAWNGR
jgi:sugar lactone lactonase YvrE